MPLSLGPCTQQWGGWRSTNPSLTPRALAASMPVKHAFLAAPANAPMRGWGCKVKAPVGVPRPGVFLNRPHPPPGLQPEPTASPCGPPLPEPPEYPRLRWRGPPSQLPSLAIVPPLARLAVRRASWSLRRAREGAGQRGVMKCLCCCSTSTKSILPHSRVRTITNL